MKITADTGLSIFLLSIVAILFIICLVGNKSDEYKVPRPYSNHVETGY